MESVELKVWGHIELDEAGLRERFERDGAAGLRQLAGEFVIWLRRGAQQWLISSPNGVVQHYYAMVGEELFHADTVLGVLRASGMEWRWNYDTLGDVAFLDHVLEEETLHPQIHRLPADCVLHVQGGKMEMSRRAWEQRYAGTGPATAEEARQAFNAACAKWMREDSVVSMSGGFDSRLILSAFLMQGKKPDLLTMGHGQSTDMVISQAVARRLGLPLTAVELKGADYLRWGPRIAELGNGVKTAWHWHTYIYPKKAQAIHGRTLFVGSNGEFARSYFLDRGMVSRLADWAPGLTLGMFWRKKLRMPLGDEALKLLAPELRQQFSPQKRQAREERVRRLCGKRLLDGLDRFYLEERVRNFIGNGLRLYADSVQWRSPFLSGEWIDTVRRMGRGWKLDAAWHRYAIARNCPELLEFPEEKYGQPMSARPLPLYWLKKGTRIVPYLDYPRLFQGEAFEAVVREGADELEGIVEKGAGAKIVEMNRQSAGGLTRLIAMLLPLIYWRRLVAEGARR